MLGQAIRAQLPLVKIVTDDLINLEAVLEHIAGKKVPMVLPNTLMTCGVGKYTSSLVYCVFPQRVDFAALYKRLIQLGSTMLVVNPPEPDPSFFDAGELGVPPEMLSDFLINTVHAEHVDPLIALLSGLSIKNVGEACRLAMSNYGSISPESISEVRRAVFGHQKGVAQVDTREGFYQPPTWMKEWLQVDGALFGNTKLPKLLRPRGLVFTGAPGVGKTSGAKHIARELGLPLFRLDIGAILGRYVGESESRLQETLAFADKNAGCVLLLDEVEKLFQQGTDDAGVTSRLLGGLLWWLQEHETRVLTLLTTNNIELLPKELYRPGRIDKVCLFEGLSLTEALPFMKQVAAQFSIRLTAKQLVSHAQELYVDKARVSQAELANTVYNLAKLAYVKQVKQLGCLTPGNS